MSEELVDAVEDRRTGEREMDVVEAQEGHVRTMPRPGRQRYSRTILLLALHSSVVIETK